VRFGQRLLDPLAVRFEADHLLRDPLDYLEAEGSTSTARSGRSGESSSVWSPVSPEDVRSEVATGAVPAGTRWSTSTWCSKMVRGILVAATRAEGREVDNR
jgi:hypothetical protein